MGKVKLDETQNRRRLHIGSFFYDLNESEYHELVKIFSSAQNKELKEEIESYQSLLDDAVKEIEKQELYKRTIVADYLKLKEKADAYEKALRFFFETNDLKKALDNTKEVLNQHSK